MKDSSISDNLEVAILFYGIFIGFFFYVTVKVASQTWTVWKRTKTLLNWYLFMIWAETIVNFTFATSTYLFIRGTIKPSLGFYIGTVVLWALQTQLLLQIIANRVGLIMVSKRKTKLIKWGLFIFIAAINISVFCIWIPALLQISQTYITLNHIWERVEKSIFLITDAALNIYFLYLVRSRLISQGLTKYMRLFNFNVATVVLSIIMDILLLGLISLPNTYAYVQFAPIVYIVKLSIELTMAELISKVVRGVHRVDGGHVSSANEASKGTQRCSRAVEITSMQSPPGYFPGSIQTSADLCASKTASHMSISDSEKYGGDGIMKTVTILARTESSRSTEHYAAEVVTDHNKCSV